MDWFDVDCIGTELSYEITGKSFRVVFVAEGGTVGTSRGDGGLLLTKCIN